MADVATTTIDGEVGVLTIDSPPVNALGVETRRGLDRGFRDFADNPAVRAIVLICGGRTFFAGADITEFGKPMQEPGLQNVFDIIEHGSKPVVAAIHGTALGGGMELALICHYRVAVPSARLGLPEVHLGLLPGAGGTQRLPRIVGVDAALDLITSGRQIGARQAKDLGVVDALADEGRLREDAVAFARNLLAESRPLLRVRDRQDMIEPAHGKPEIFAEFRRKNARSFRGFKAPENIIRTIEAAVALPFEEGMKREAELFLDLYESTESLAQRHVFFAERQTSKIADVPADTPTLPVRSVGVIGAGTMGGGITMNFASVGIPVTLVETDQVALDRGLAIIRRNYENTAKKGRMTQEQVEACMGLITPALTLESLAETDLIVEAVFESMSLKLEVFGKLGRIARPDAILASNTSFLDLDAIAEATISPERVIGLHFFSPANVMRLLEVVRGARTSKQIVATAMKLARQIGKVAVLSRVCDGFIANRLMAPRMAQSEALVLEGPTPAEIDRVIYDYGFAMGPFQMIDLVGLDVIGRDANVSSLRGDLVARDRLGQKKNGGFYDYDEKRTPTPSPVAAKIIADFAESKGVLTNGLQSDSDILARLLYPVVNEGAKILEEGIALRAGDIDMAAILGYGWPVYTGGPMFWADTVGLPTIVSGLKEMQAAHGDAFAPAHLLETMAAEGKRFSA